MRKRRRINRPAYVMGAVALALFLAVIWLAARQRAGPEGLAYEPNAVVGTVNRSPEEVRAELEAQVAEGLVSFSINATPCGKRGADVNWMIENPENNAKLIAVEVTLDETGETIYKTGAIRPGMYVMYAPPQRELAPGEYRCTAMIRSYRLETEEFIGQAGAELLLTIE